MKNSNGKSDRSTEESTEWNVPEIRTRPDGEGNSTVLIYARFRNCGSRASSWLANFVVPKELGVCPIDPAEKSHYLNVGDVFSEVLVPGKTRKVKLTACKGELPPTFTSGLAVKIVIPRDLKYDGEELWPINIEVEPYLRDHYEKRADPFRMRLSIRT